MKSKNQTASTLASPHLSIIGKEFSGLAREPRDFPADSRLDNHVGGRNHYPRELRASEPRVGYALTPVLKSRRRPIIQSGFRSTNAAYPLLHIDTLNNALSSSTRKDDVDPVLHVPGYSSDGKQSACCHVKRGDVRILAPISGDGICSPSSLCWLTLTAPRSRSFVRVRVHTDVRRDPTGLLRSVVSGGPQR